MTKLKVLSLFAGIGGIDLGLEKTEGFETVAFCEIDSDCIEILNKHWPNIPVYKDVKKLEVYNGPDGNNYLTDSLDENEYPINCTSPDIDVIVGGFPCQDISIGGKGKGIVKGERSSLWKEYARLIDTVRPKYAIIENVNELRNNGLGVVLRDLSRIGYDAEWYTLTATGVCNLPHQRKRLFIIAYPRSQRCDEYSGEERHLQVDQEWSSKEVYSNGEECQSESIQVRQILSRRQVDSFRATHSGRESTVSELRRVTNGIPTGLDEKERKSRIKQLGNAVVPDIAELIGLAVLEREKQAGRLKC